MIFFVGEMFGVDSKNSRPKNVATNGCPTIRKWLHYCTYHILLHCFCKCRHILSAFHGSCVSEVQSHDMSFYPPPNTASNSRTTQLESRFYRGFPRYARPQAIHIWQNKNITTHVNHFCLTLTLHIYVFFHRTTRQKPTFSRDV